MQPSYPPPGYDPYQQQKKGPIGWLIGGGVLLAALIGFGLGTGFFGLMGGSKPALNQQANAQPILPQTQEPAPVFMQEAQPAPITPQEAKRMPQDILDWLKHLEETERRYRAHVQGLNSSMAIDGLFGATTQGLSPEQFSGLAEGDLDQLGQSGASQAGSKSVAAHEAKAEEIIAFFRSKTPPTECVPIYQTYMTSMNEINSMMADFRSLFDQIKQGNDGSQDAIDSLKGRITELQEISNDNRSRADAPRRETDDLVRRICDKYETRKWFTITGDIGGGIAGALTDLGKGMLSGLADR